MNKEVAKALNDLADWCNEQIKHLRAAREAYDRRRDWRSSNRCFHQIEAWQEMRSEVRDRAAEASQ